MDFVADLPAFLSDFAIDLTIDGQPVRGIFDDAASVAFGGMINGTAPMLQIQSTVTVARGSAVLIGTDVYTVRAIEPNSSGITLLRLEAA